MFRKVLRENESIGSSWYVRWRLIPDLFQVKHLVLCQTYPQTFLYYQARLGMIHIYVMSWLFLHYSWFFCAKLLLDPILIRN